MPGEPDITGTKQDQTRELAERLWLASEMGVLSPRRTFNMNDAVDVALFLTDRMFKSAGVRVTRKLRARLPEVDAKMGEIEQVLVNVLVNACEATLSGGEVRVATDFAEDGRSVEVRIEDTGMGIPAKLLEKVFEPFFSTKGRLGMGLSAARELIWGCGGSFRMESIPGEGTKVVVGLPVVSG